MTVTLTPHTWQCLTNEPALPVGRITYSDIKSCTNRLPCESICFHLMQTQSSWASIHIHMKLRPEVQQHSRQRWEGVKVWRERGENMQEMQEWTSRIVCYWMLRFSAWDIWWKKSAMAILEADCICIIWACTKCSILCHLRAMWCARFGLWCILTMSMDISSAT